MEAVQNSIASLADLFHKKMSEFEADLKRTPTTSPTTSSLSTEFAAFKTFIVQALTGLQKQVEVLALDIDRLEMRGRRKMLLIHGVTEGKKEETSQVAATVVRDLFKLPDFTESEIRRCHRMGRATSSDKPRPIVIKLQSLAMKNTIWFAKTKLKGSGITVSEFLTKSRHQLFMSARDKFGVNKCWTRDGIVFVLGADGTQHRLNSLDDFTKVAPEQDESMKTNATEAPQTTVPAKNKRAAARK